MVAELGFEPRQTESESIFKYRYTAKKPLYYLVSLRSRGFSRVRIVVWIVVKIYAIFV